MSVSNTGLSGSQNNGSRLNRRGNFTKNQRSAESAINKFSKNINQLFVKKIMQKRARFIFKIREHKPNTDRLFIHKNNAIGLLLIEKPRPPNWNKYNF